MVVGLITPGVALGPRTQVQIPLRSFGQMCSYSYISNKTNKPPFYSCISFSKTKLRLLVPYLNPCVIFLLVESHCGVIAGSCGETL